MSLKQQETQSSNQPKSQKRTRLVIKPSETIFKEKNDFPKQKQIDSLLLVSLFVATCLGIILMNNDSSLLTKQVSLFSSHSPTPSSLK